MGAISLNPGFVLIAAAFLMLAAPKSVRAPLMAGAAALSMWLLLDNEFGAASAVAQMGLSVVLLNLDALNRVFGIGFLIALVLLAIYTSGRRNRLEDAAITLLAGGAVSALFVGDLVSFVAALALAGLSATWLLFVAPVAGAAGAGARLLIWHGLEGLLFLVGVAFHISAGAENSVFKQLDIASLGGGFIFAALMIRVGAPFAHVWLKDAIGHASGAGAVALAVFSSTLGVYALARLFPAEPALIFVGAAMTVLGLIYAAAEDDLRRSAAYVLTAQMGVCVALIGDGSPLARAASQAHVFSLTFAFSLLLMAHGAIIERHGASALSGLRGLARGMPVTSLLLLCGGLSVAGMPGFASYVSYAVALAAVGDWEQRLLWTLLIVNSAALIVILIIRPASVVYVATDSAPPHQAAIFPMMLGMSLSAFFCIAVGFNPHWLYQLMPTELAFSPYTFDRLAPALEAIGAAALTYLALRLVRFAPTEKAQALLDMDVFYRGPVSGAGRWAGIVLLRLYGAWQVAFDRVAVAAGALLARAARACDLPYKDSLAGAVLLVATAGILLIICLSWR
ncbi:MAG: proton-conducting transporter membrane subunit [Hyphomonadaceae bacterium]|nr:proton-conducting transporter membrane subunit [Hyphomonadaceae bacterium]